jgi:MFS transporter, DHA2 family, glioxin efflux transporter
MDWMIGGSPLQYSCDLAATGMMMTNITSKQLAGSSLGSQLDQISNCVIVCVTVGGAFFVSAAQSAVNNQLIKELINNLADKDLMEALAIGATNIIEVFSTSEVPIIAHAYMVGLKAVFAIAAVAFGISTLVGSLGS